MSENLTRVCVLYTGGTIGMVRSDESNPLSPLVPATRDQLEKHVPGLASIGVEWEVCGLVDEKGNEIPPLDSSDVNAVHWIHMARAIEDAYPKYDGFVVLHGTDTMAYTASGLSFLLRNLGKPVVITGSQLPIFALRTDAVQNLVNAVHIAGYKATGLPLVPEVTICFADRLYRGNRVRKRSTSAWQGFVSPNYPPLGAIGEHIEIDREFVLPTPEAKFYADTHLVTDVMDVGLFPGLKPSQLSALLRLPQLRGIVLRTFGAGNAPSDPDFLEVIEKATDAGKIILNVSQCDEGLVEMGLYAASSGLLERGVISGMDMTPEAALAKMMWILATQAGREIHAQLQVNQCGEQSENLIDIRYGSRGSRSEPISTPELVSERPPGDFRMNLLTRAVLRISRLDFVDVAVGEPVEVRVFINMPSATKDTSPDDPHCACVFNEVYSAEPTKLLHDVTNTVRQVASDGRPINITLVVMKDVRFWYDGLYLALFARVV